MNSEERVKQLGTRPMLPLILSLALPAVCGNITTALYNVVDRLFVGNFVGTNALGAIALMTPLNNITAAITVMLTIGGGAMISMSLGRNDRQKANEAFTNIIGMAAISSLMVSLVFFLFAEQLVTLCGADQSSALHNPGVTYLRIIAFGQCFHVINLGIAGVIRAEGNTQYSMIVTMVGALLNVIFDALFVLVFNMGLAGAGIATVISQIAGCAVSSSYYIRKKGVCRFCGFQSVNIVLMGRIISLGAAPAVFQGLGLVNNLITNNSLMVYGNQTLGLGGGDLAISALSVTSTVESIATMIVIGLNNGVSSVISYNYGSGQYDRAKEATLIGQVLATMVSTLIWILMMFTPQLLFSIFSNGDTALIEYGIYAMRKSKLFILFIGFQTLASMFYSAIGKPKIATMISISRNGLFLIPALLILPRIYGLDGVLYSSAVSDLCSMIIVSVVYFKGVNQLGKKQKEVYSKGADVQC